MDKSNATKETIEVLTLPQILQERGPYSMMTVHEAAAALGIAVGDIRACYYAIRTGRFPIPQDRIFKRGQRLMVRTVDVLRELGAEIPSVSELAQAV
jgi:hypothetical protein